MHFKISKENENVNNKAAAKHKSYSSDNMYVNLMKNGKIFMLIRNLRNSQSETENQNLK